ncbi:MAG: Aspartate--tRNA ligase [Parcubacteria group bacterium ADurb.Bin159]|jgi:aspartyl-tRNA synthetase|nr:MAG: Aspartate--tRNA ligase [Parcubacteria group bacterium ADurb.Bin159]
MERTLAKDTIKKQGEDVRLCGWINTKRKMGKIIFADLRDYSGLVQIVFPSGINEELKKIAEAIKPEYVVEIIGKVVKRPENQINSDLLTGEIEVEIKRGKIISSSLTPPFTIDNEIIRATEETRLTYRYLDLRHKRMKDNLTFRYRLIKSMRDFLDEKGFIEIETPYLTKGTPEGSREYIVPSRLYPGKFYVLPQAPQQFKQLLMIAGMERYFQFARCFRDEDSRGDRQPEFTQLDMEMSFMTEEEILALVEEMVIKTIKENFPEKKIKYPFPHLKAQDVLEKYKTDKPDLRENKDDKDELAFVWIRDFSLFEYSETEKKIVSTHNPFTLPYEEDIPLLDKEPLKVRAHQYDLVCNGCEIAGGALRIYDPNLQYKIFRLLEVNKKEIERKFGKFLKAFEYGAPPHGGIAFGFDRLIMLLRNEPNIREVIAFPKTTDAKDLMLGAPDELPEKQIKEVHWGQPIGGGSF